MHLTPKKLIARECSVFFLNLQHPDFGAVKSWHISCFAAQRAQQRARVVSFSQGRMIPYKEKTFDELVVDGLRGSMPGAYSSGRPKSTYNKSHYRNVFSERAKDGFRYWLIERPKPTNCKYLVRKYVIFKPEVVFIYVLDGCCLRFLCLTTVKIKTCFIFN